MNYKLSSLILLLLILTFSCEDGLQLEEDTRISNEEIEAIEDCQSEAIETQKQIEENLIGTWKLVGYACGNCIDGKAPTATISFQANEGRIQYEDEFEQIDGDFTWSIEESTNIFGDPVLALKTKPFYPGLFAEVFCKDYMSYNATPVDGPLLIYKKQ